MAYAGHLVEVIVDTFYRDDEGMSPEEEHGIVFEAQCGMFHGLVLHHLLHFGSRGVESLSPQDCHLDFRVEIAVECGNEVVKSVEDRQYAHHGRRGDGNAGGSYGTDDVDGVRALLGEQVATGYEEGKIHFFRSSSMCSI